MTLEEMWCYQNSYYSTKRGVS